jgi:hypothetical protein
MANGTIAASQLEMLSLTGTGIITITPPATNTNRTLTLPDNTGTVLTTASTFGATGPAFSAYMSSDQSITSGVNTVLQVNTEEFDTANCFDTSTYRFTPTVAGYYQVNGQLSCRGATAVTRFYILIFKNGSIAKYGTDIFTSLGNNGYKTSVATLIYMNGTTDYLQLGGNVTATTAQFTSDGSVSNYFQAFLARAA